MLSKKPQETTENIYSLENLKSACSQGSVFKFVFFNDFNEEDTNSGNLKAECLSRFYPINFCDEDGNIYSSLFQYIVSQKAKLFDDLESFHKIMSSSSNQEIYQIDKSIKNFNEEEFIANRDQIAYQGNIYKFSQNENLKEFILKYSLNTIFVDNDPNDKYWGIHLSIDDPSIIDPTKWQGNNKHGFQLTELRDEFYKQVNSEENTQNPLPIIQSYDISEIPGLYAGEYPGTKDEDSSIQKVNQMIQFGIKHFIDLTGENELIPYKNLVVQNGTYMKYPIKNHGVPISIDSVHQLINMVKEMLSEQKGYVYIHCRSGKGRTSMILACIISELIQISDFDAVLNILNRNFWRMPKTHGTKPSLKEKKQIEFVKNYIQYIDKANQNFNRTVPIYFFTDIHMNKGPLNGIVDLTDGIVAINGDIVLGVKFLYHKGVLGSKKSHSIVRTEKGKWTDPNRVIEILSHRQSNYPVILGFGNHEVNKMSFNNSSTNLCEFVQSLKKINVIPLCTYPDLSLESSKENYRIGAYKSYKFCNTYFFSYITSAFVKYTNDKQMTRLDYEIEGIECISNEIQKVCDSNTSEIIFLSHTGASEGIKIVEGIIKKLAELQSINELKFNLLDIHFNFVVGHKHSSSVSVEYRNHNHYWEGKIKVEVLDKKKTVHYIFPNCADDCIRIDPNNGRCLFAKFTTGKNL